MCIRDRYYIDFASKFGIPYIIMDEGWAKSTRDPYTPNPKVDLHELIRYGKEKDVYKRQTPTGSGSNSFY